MPLRKKAELSGSLIRHLFAVKDSFAIKNDFLGNPSAETGYLPALTVISQCFLLF
jgi:hypothetical protein